MAALSNHVSISITQDTVAVSREGYGTIMLLSANAAFAERVREYSSLAEVAVDFASTTGPEYLAAQAIFSQSPTVESIKIGRLALKPTLVYTLVPVVTNSYTYTLTISGDGITTTDVSYTSDASATATEICDGLRTEINNVVGNNYATSGTSTLIITGDAAGEWFSVSCANPEDFDMAMTHSDPGVATDLAAIAVEDNDWYCLYNFYNSNAMAVAIAAYAEANKKIFVCDIAETDAVTTAAGNSDTLDDLATADYERTMGVYAPYPNEMLGAAWAGRVLCKDPGNITWYGKRLAGVTAPNLTTTQRSRIVARNANSIETVAGLKITFTGQGSDAAFFDIVRDLDFTESEMAADVFTDLVSQDKLPYLDDGIAVIENAVRGTLQRLSSAAYPIFDRSSIVVTVPALADVSDADKAARILRNVKWSATLQGAIHKVIVTGVVSA